MSIDLKKIIRSRKPEKQQAQLTARPDTALICASDIAGKGRQVFVPDTNIYIMDAAGTLPQACLQPFLPVGCSLLMPKRGRTRRWSQAFWHAQNFQKQQLKALLNDALVYLCAVKHGLPVLTNNKAECDPLHRVQPAEASSLSN